MSPTSCVPRPSLIGRPLPSRRKWMASPAKLEIDAALVAIGDRLGFVVGALHQADGGIERKEPSDVGGGATQVGLQADPGLRGHGPEPLVEDDRLLRVGAALHVDPQVRPGLGGVVRQGDEVGEAGVRIVVEAQLGGLDRDLAAHPGRLDPIEDLEVVVDDRLGLLEAVEVLAETRVHRGDPGPFERHGRGQGVIERLAGHEPPDGPLHESHPGQPFLQPPIPSGPQKDATHVSSSTTAITTAPMDGTRRSG